MAKHNVDKVSEALPPYIDQTELAKGNYGKPLLLNRVFQLIIDVLDGLQNTAGAQANRLNILSNWQQAYTAELNQIHSFTAGNGDGQDAGGDSLDGSGGNNIRQNLNSLNSIFTQQIQGNNTIVGDDAKALQSNINQTTSEVQAQTDMATAILQQLSTILTSIYQSSGA